MDRELLTKVQKLGYKDLDEIEALLAEVKNYFSRLKPRIVDYEQGNNVTTNRLAFIGELPILALGKHVQLRIWLPLMWPDVAPIIHVITNPVHFVNPAGLVDSQGRIQHTYLKQWKRGANLVDFLQTLIIEFTDTLPVFDLGQFELPNEVKDNLMDVMINYPDFKPSLSQFESEEGAKSEELLLEGSVPVHGEFGTFFRVPLRIWLFHDFPQVAPHVFIIASDQLKIKITRSLYRSGRVKHNSLKNWKHPGSSLGELLQQLTIEFSECPPIHTVGFKSAPKGVRKHTSPKSKHKVLDRELAQGGRQPPDIHSTSEHNRHSRTRRPSQDETQDAIPADQDRTPDTIRVDGLATRVKKPLPRTAPSQDSNTKPGPDLNTKSATLPVASQPPPDPGKRKPRSNSTSDLQDVLGFVQSAKLTEETATCLLEHGFTSLRAILCMQVEDLQRLGLPMGEFCILRESLRQLKRARRDAYDNVEMLPREGLQITDSSKTETVIVPPSSTAEIISSKDDGDVMTRAIRSLLKPLTVTREELDILEVIGRGEYGVVHKGLLRRKDSSVVEDVAVKTIVLSTDNDTLVEDFVQEILQMKMFSHPNVMSLRGLAMLDGKPFMLLPYMANGDLKKHVSDPSKDMTIEDILRLALHVARGMKYLADQQFVHGDLAARNCLVDADCVVKVGDFGLSKQLHLSEYYRMDTDKSRPLRWMAPESLLDLKYTLKSDVWSFGVLLWELMTRGERPYNDVKNVGLIPDMIKAGYRLKCPSYTPGQVEDVMQDCWTLNDSERPGFDMIIHWLQTLIASDGAAPVSRRSSTRTSPRPMSTGTGSSHPPNRCNPPPQQPPHQPVRYSPPPPPPPDSSDTPDTAEAPPPLPPRAAPRRQSRPYEEYLTQEDERDENGN